MAHKNVGGQAVIEGVMMRNKDLVATAVRKPDGSIIVKKEKINFMPKWKIIKWPFFRGVSMLFETMIIGVKTLNFSANESLDESPETKEENTQKNSNNSKKNEKETSNKNKKHENAPKEELSTWQITLTFIFAFAFAILIFKFLPLLITEGIEKFVPYLKTHGFLFNAIEGIIKVIFFVSYIWIISFMKDIKRLFQYHGAEHKSIHCYEADEELTVENVKKHTPLHPRCGTSFIIFVLLISVIVYTIIPHTFGFWSKFGLRVLFLPVIAGISYELLKLNSKFPKSKLLYIIDKPGLWIQNITTNEPDEKQIEVAIKALKAVLDEKETSITH